MAERWISRVWLTLYCAGFGLAGIATAGWGVARVTTSEALQMPMVGVAAFVVASAIAAFVPTLVRTHISASLAGLVTFTALLIGGAPLAAVSSIGGAVAAIVRVRAVGLQRYQRASFNAGMLVSISALAGAAFERSGAVGSIERLLTPGGFAWAMASVLAYAMLNNLAIAVAIYLDSGEALRSTLRSAGGAFHQVFYAGLSVVAAVMILEIHWATLVLLIIPTMVARSGLLGFAEHEASYDRWARTIAKAIELKDPYTRGHGDRVAELTVAVAKAKGYDYQQLRIARYAALLHDVGKIVVPLRVITKPGALTDAEFDEIRKHPDAGAEILAEIDFLRPALDAVRYHHERLDGRGYPNGLVGDEVPEVARIVTIVDAFDAMTSTRSYRHARPVDQAFAELRRCAGPQFDADLVELAIDVIGRLDWQPTYGMPTADDILADLEGTFDDRELARTDDVQMSPLFVDEAPAAAAS